MREIRNAIIKGTTLGFEDHGIMTAFVSTRSGVVGQSFGGYSLGGMWGMEFIKAVLRTLEVEKWEDLPGKHCRMDASHEKVHRIGHIIENKWFDPEEDLKSFLPPPSGEKREA